MTLVRRRWLRPIELRGGRIGGFTLIEMIVVLVILGLALSIVAGFVARPNVAAELASATERVVGAMRLARMRAMTESRAVLIGVTADGHGIRADNVDINLGARVWVAASNGGVLRFGPDGGATATVLRVRVAGMERLIQADWLTGRITAGGSG